MTGDLYLAGEGLPQDDLDGPEKTAERCVPDRDELLEAVRHHFAQTVHGSFVVAGRFQLGERADFGDHLRQARLKGTEQIAEVEWH